MLHHAVIHIGWILVHKLCPGLGVLPGLRDHKAAQGPGTSVPRRELLKAVQCRVHIFSRPLPENIVDAAGGGLTEIGEQP